MNSRTVRGAVAGPAGRLETAVDMPADADGRPLPPLGTAVLCHPNPQFGGTLDNKVVQTLARALVQLGWRCVRFNTRGTGASEGAWDEGRGEVDDALAVVDAEGGAGDAALLLGGFSFGGYLATATAARLAQAGRPARRLLLVAPAVTRFPVAPVPPDTLVVQGETDDVVPLADVLAWAGTQSLPVTVVPGAGHFFHGQLPLLKRIVLDAMRG